jgi:AcrR family transcriptional regulator
MIYYYFKDKGGLYQAVLERSHTDLLQTSQNLELEQLFDTAAIALNLLLENLSILRRWLCFTLPIEMKLQ